MPTVEERVAYLEGRTEEHAGAIGELRQDIRELRSEMIRRFDAVDRRFDGVGGQFVGIDEKFRWVIGLQFATILAIVAAIANAYFR
jgi:hypothetical protein